MGQKRASIQNVVVTRRGFPSIHEVELLLLHCTFSINHEFGKSNHEKHSEVKALLVADLSPPVDVNWTVASRVGPLVDRKFENPAYVDPSRCPCDLTDGMCDTNCCCDLVSTLSALFILCTSRNPTVNVF